MTKEMRALLTDLRDLLEKHEAIIETDFDTLYAYVKGTPNCKSHLGMSAIDADDLTKLLESD